MQVFKNNFAPNFESSTEFLVLDKGTSVITVQVDDDRDFAKDPSLGKVTVSLQDLFTAKERQQDWFPLKGAKTGRIRLSAEWKPLGMSGSVNGGSGWCFVLLILTSPILQSLTCFFMVGSSVCASDRDSQNSSQEGCGCQVSTPVTVVAFWSLLIKVLDCSRNVEAALGGKSDPYVRVMSGGNVLARTEVVNNSMFPDYLTTAILAF